MAPRPEAFDADALADSAIALRMAADAGLIRQREALAARMNLNTLLALRTQLGCLDNLTANEHFSDPVKGPMLRSIQTFWFRVEIDAERSNSEFVRRALDAADARTKIPRPKIPCDLEPTLRYGPLARFPLDVTRARSDSWVAKRLIHYIQVSPRFYLFHFDEVLATVQKHYQVEAVSRGHPETRGEVTPDQLTIRKPARHWQPKAAATRSRHLVPARALPTGSMRLARWDWRAR